MRLAACRTAKEGDLNSASKIQCSVVVLGGAKVGVVGLGFVLATTVSFFFFVRFFLPLLLLLDSLSLRRLCRCAMFLFEAEVLAADVARAHRTILSEAS